MEIFSFFPELCTNSEAHADPPIWGNYTTLPETYLLSVFSAISTILLLKTCLFSDLRRKTLKRMQTNQYRITLPKRYILMCF